MKTGDGQITELGKTETEKDLGVTIDSIILAFSAHMNNTVKKANQLTGMIRRSFNCTDREIFTRSSSLE